MNFDVYLVQYAVYGAFLCILEYVLKNLLSVATGHGYKPFMPSYNARSFLGIHTNAAKEVTSDEKEKQKLKKELADSWGYTPSDADVDRIYSGRKYGSK